jgi:hypothetical protein
MRRVEAIIGRKWGIPSPMLITEKVSKRPKLLRDYPYRLHCRFMLKYP